MKFWLVFSLLIGISIIPFLINYNGSHLADLNDPTPSYASVFEK